MDNKRSIQRRWTLLFVVLWLFTPAVAQSLKPSFSQQAELHAKLKTAYLFNTAKFVTWTEENKSVRLCLRGKSATPRLASKLDGKPLGDGRRLEIQHGIDTKSDCHIVFDDSSTSAKEREDLLSKLDAAQVLLISDGSQALTMGYTMQFFVQDDSVRFALDNERLKQAKFKVSSKLQRLARKPDGR